MELLLLLLLVLLIFVRLSIQFREAIATHEKGLAMWTEFMVSFQSLAVTP